MNPFGSVLSRLRNGFVIAKASFGVLRRETWLLVFPLLYGLAWVIGLAGLVLGILAAVFGAAYGMAFLEQFGIAAEGNAETVLTVVGVVGSFLFMFVATSIATFFSAALVHSTGNLFADEPTSVRDGLAGAWESKRTILAWGVVGAVVGLIFQALESQDGRGAQLVRAIAGFAWFAMTFFIVPVIVFREGGVRDSLRESAQLFKDTWGEVGGISLGVGLVIMPLAVLIGGAGIAAPLFLLEDPWTVLTYTLVPTLLMLGALVVVHNAATAVAKTALYQYATEGTMPPEFDGVDPDAITRRKRGSQSVSGTPSERKPGQI